jgi:hypothetical protein
MLYISPAISIYNTVDIESIDEKAIVTDMPVCLFGSYGQKNPPFIYWIDVDKIDMSWIELRDRISHRGHINDCTL